MQPSPYDIWLVEEALKLIAEALVYNERLKSAFVINRRIANTAIGRDVRQALANYDAPTLKARVTQHVIFEEVVARGLAVHELDSNGTPATLDEWVRKREADVELGSIKRLMIDIPETLHRAIKSHCAIRGTKMGDEVRELSMQKYGFSSPYIPALAGSSSRPHNLPVMMSV